jgi:branched-chain amino acid transport system substrate-binding protein
MSSLTAIAVAPMLRDRRVCLVTGAESGLLLAQANPQLVLTGPGQTLRLGKLARWASTGLRARRIALLWSNSEAQRDIRDAFLQAARGIGLEIAADVAAAPSQPAATFAAALAADVARIVQSTPDAVFLAAGQEQAATMLVALRVKAPTMVVFGEASLLNGKTLDQAGPAAIGLHAHVPLTADAPLSNLEAFRERFNTRFKEAPEAAAIKGYIAVAMVKAAVERLGRIDPHAVADALRGQSYTARDQPGLLLDTAWTGAGEADRPTFMAELREGRSLSWSVLPPMRG